MSTLCNVYNSNTDKFYHTKDNLNIIASNAVSKTISKPEYYKSLLGITTTTFIILLSIAGVSYFTGGLGMITIIISISVLLFCILSIFLLVMTLTTKDDGYPTSSDESKTCKNDEDLKKKISENK